MAVPDEDAVMLWHVDGVTIPDGEPAIAARHAADVIDIAYEPTAAGRMASIDAAGHLHVCGLDRPSKVPIASLGRSARCLRWRPVRPEVVIGDAEGDLHFVSVGA